MLSADEITALIIALTGLIAAVTGLIVAVRQINVRIDGVDTTLAAHEHVGESSSTKVLPPNNPL